MNVQATMANKVNEITGTTDFIDTAWVKQPTSCVA